MKFLSAFFRELGGAVLRPRDYYSSLVLHTPSGRHILKALVYGLLSGVLFFVFQNVLRLESFQTVFGFLPVPEGRFWGVLGACAYVLAAPLGLLVSAAWLLIVSDIGRGNSEFRDAVSAAAPMLFLGPLGVAASALGGLDRRVSLLLEIALAVYTLVLAYKAAVYGLKAKKDSVLAVLIVAGLILTGTRALSNAVGGAAGKDGGGLGQKILELMNETDGGLEDESGDPGRGEYRGGDGDIDSEDAD